MRSCPHCLTPYSAAVEFCGIDGHRLQEYETDPLLGTDVERYTITHALGDGAMARVYRAKHKVLEREYAVKVLFGEIAANKTLAERFRREAQVISKLNHPNVVSVIDFGSTANGLTFLTMELIEGRTLREAIRGGGGPFTPERAGAIVKQIALGLAEAHERGFVHRDLKPSNVMIVEDNRGEAVKILDFGLARAADSEGEKDSYLTRTGQFLGTPIYMAPEQIVGADVAPSADLYALGVVLFEMLEGKPPFRAKKLAEIRKKHLVDAPPEVRPSHGLEVLVRELLEKAPERRPASAREVVARIDALDLSALQPTEITVRTAVPQFAPDHAAAEAQLTEPPVLELAPPPPPARAAKLDAIDEVTALLEVLPQAPSPVPPPAIVPPPAAIVPPPAAIVPPPAAIVPPPAAIDLSRARESPERLASSIHALEPGELSLVESRVGALPQRSARVLLAGGVVAVIASLVLVVVMRGPKEQPQQQQQQPPAAVPQIAPVAEPAAIAREPEVVPPPVDPPPPPEPEPEEPRAVAAEAPAKKWRRELATLDASLARESARRGLTAEELAQIDELGPKLEKWRAARAGKNRAQLEAAHGALVAAIRDAKIDAKILRRKLDRISAKLARVSSNVPLELLRPLEDRYLELEKSLATSPSEKDANRLAIAAAELLRDLEAARSAQRAPERAR